MGANKRSKEEVLQEQMLRSLTPSENELSFQSEVTRSELDRARHQVEEQRHFILQQNQANQQLLAYNHLQKGQLEEVKAAREQLTLEIKAQKNHMAKNAQLMAKLQALVEIEEKNKGEEEGKEVQPADLPYGQDIFPIMKVRKAKAYGHPFWKTDVLHLVPDFLFGRYQFDQNVVYESFSRGCRFLLVERVFENNKTLFTKLKKLDNAPLSEIMQYDRAEQLETVSGELDQKVFTLEGDSWWVSYQHRWALNDGVYRLGVTKSFYRRNYVTYLAEQYFMQTTYGLGFQGVIGKGERSCTALATPAPLQEVCINVYGLNG